MKLRLGYLILSFLVGLMTVSCSETDIEKAARTRLSVLMHDQHINGWKVLNITFAPMQLGPIELQMKNDDFCVLQFDADIRNNTGEHRVNSIEYIYLETNSDVRGYDEKPSQGQSRREGFSILRSTDEVEITDKMLEDEAYLQKNGISLRYLLSHTAKDIAKKYRQEILRLSHIAPDDKKLEECILYHAILLKLDFCSIEFKESVGENRLIDSVSSLLS